MISDFSKKKSRDRAAKKSHASERGKSGAHQDQDIDAEFAGIELSLYAKDQNISEHEVWNKIRSGDLIGRSFNGKLYIHEPNGGTASELDRLQASGDLPPLPDRDDSYSQNTLQESNAPEMALLLDHLSLSKEENKEILRLSQDSITRITQMSDTIVALKDELLRAKEEQLDGLREKMKTKDFEITQLKQELEDLRMLAAAMGQAESESN